MPVPLVNPQLESGAFLWEGCPVGVLLTHGFTATAAEVRLFGKYLNDAGYTVAAPLLPGHATQPEDLNHVLWLDWVTALENTYNQLRQRCTTLFVGGESAGGVLSLFFASQHPEVAGIILAAPAIRLQVDPFKAFILQALSPFIPFVRKARVGDNPNWQGYAVNPLRGAVQLLHLQKATIKRLPLIHQPLLIFQGRHDQTIDPHSGELIMERVSSPSKKLVWMENSAHVIWLEGEVEKTAQIALKWMKAI